MAPQPLLLPALIDVRARKTPMHTFAALPCKFNTLEAGLRHITYGEFAVAIDRAAFWLDSVLGKVQGAQRDVFAYSGPTDLRYPILVIAAIKTGRKVQHVPMYIR